MTHYLRSRHDAILVGVGTALADNPTLNCRLAGSGGFGGLGWISQPRPVIIDPSARWHLSPDSKVLKAVKAGRGRAPWIIVAPGTNVDAGRLQLLQAYGGKYVTLPDIDARFHQLLKWEGLLRALAEEGIRSVMIEGGGVVINDFLGHAENRGLVGSVVVTVAPTYLGAGGVVVCPDRRYDGNGVPVPVVRFKDVRWCPLGQDVVMCARMESREQEMGDPEAEAETEGNVEDSNGNANGNGKGSGNGLVVLQDQTRQQLDAQPTQRQTTMDVPSTQAGGMGNGNSSGNGNGSGSGSSWSVLDVL